MHATKKVTKLSEWTYKILSIKVLINDMNYLKKVTERREGEREGERERGRERGVRISKQP